jgi:septal ring factor EnvC (AmiA/AmiB activator)
MARGAKRARALVACAAGALAGFLAIGVAGAQTSRTAAQAERDRRAETTRAERLRNQAAEVRRDMNALDARLVESSRRRAEAEAAAATAELRLADLQTQIDTESLRQRRARDAFESALIAAAFAERRVEPRLVRAGLFAGAAARDFQRMERRSRETLTAARQTETQIAEEQRILAEAQAAIEAERTEVAALLTRRRAMQVQLANDATAAERRARTFAAEARSLRDLAARVQRASARRTPAAPSSTASTLPAAWQAPAQGTIARAFGTREGQAPASQGITLSTRGGAQVLAPAAAEVAYAGAFRSYGNVLILNIDGGYAIVLAGLGSFQARLGDTVRAGQPVGEMAAIPAPELYVEVRQNGQPINPGRWWSSSGRTAATAQARAG